MTVTSAVHPSNLPSSTTEPSAIKLLPIPISHRCVVRSGETLIEHITLAEAAADARVKLPYKLSSDRRFPSWRIARRGATATRHVPGRGLTAPGGEGSGVSPAGVGKPPLYKARAKIPESSSFVSGIGFAFMLLDLAAALAIAGKSARVTP